MSVQRMLGHLPALIHPKPKSVLIVGCGAGVTAGTFVVHPDIERIVICEIEPLIPPAAARYFDVENYEVMKDPRVEIIYDDARHFLATTKESFDIITSDPIHPWVKGAAALYSTEYFSLTKRHLNPGGVVTQWAPLYESNPEAANSQIATFMLSFPDGAVWSNLDQGEGYDLVLLAQDGPMRIDVAALDERLNRPDHQKVLRSLRDVGLGSAVSLLSTYAGRGPDLAGWIDKRNINSDVNMRLQYLAGFGLNYYQGDAIYRSILAHRKFPDDLIVAAGEQREQLRRRLERP
jgi:spermidine synthase